VYLFDLDTVDEVTDLKKRLLVDLLDIADPRDIGAAAGDSRSDRFTFPLQSVESVTPVDAFTLLVGPTTTIPAATAACLACPTAPRSSRCARRRRSAGCAWSPATDDDDDRRDRKHHGDDDCR
jgi:hypothetical protein